MGAKLRFVGIVVAAFLTMRYLRPKVATTVRLVPDESYDYIVVGAGAAGCVLANRLTEDGVTTVLLLEAGDDHGKYGNVHVPAVTPLTLGSSADWQFRTVPQEGRACGGMEEGRCGWPSGKVLGGSTAINGMVYARGNRHDYDEWSRRGCEGWGYEDGVMPYFWKSEGNRNAHYVASGSHGGSGPLVVSDNAEQTTVHRAVLRAAKELGHVIGDVNGQLVEGFTHHQSTIKDGVRWSTARAYLHPAMDRKNLHITTKARVTRLVMDGGKQVSGVEYVDTGKPNQDTGRVVRARKEVILSAGTVGSPQILMLSGIGPKSHLRSLGIPLVQDLPVGDNLHDHVTMPSSMQYQIQTPVSLLMSEASSWKSQLQYALYGGGLLGSPFSLEGTGLVRSKHQDDNDKSPHIGIYTYGTLLGHSNTTLSVASKITNLKESVARTLFANCENMHGISFQPTLLQPRSRGTLRLRSRDPFEQPLLDPRFLEDPRDVDVLLEAIRNVQSLAKTKALKKKLGANYLRRTPEDCHKQVFDTDDYWRCVIGQLATGMNHAVGTCSMGDPADASTVVDPQLRVKGVGKLRVVDASVMPKVISGGTMAATVMIAERATDIILYGR